MTRAEKKASEAILSWRRRLLLASFAGLAGLLLARAVQLQVLDNAFLAGEGHKRHLRIEKVSAHRGPITDRHGEPLAVSTPVDSIWAHPRELSEAAGGFAELAGQLERDAAWLARRVTSNLEREFVYLRRHMRPDRADQVMALGLPGVYRLREYRRYYPAAEVTGHVVGFTNIDDSGQEGLELAYDHWLRGEPGAKRVLKDRLGRSVEDVERIRPPRPGKPLATSLDLRIQYLAYRELKAAVRRHHAASGSMVVLDVASGEILAMVNQPSYNPNDRAQLEVARYRNRAVTDIFEPGSSFKPFVIAAALESGRFSPGTAVETAPGFINVGAKTIEDPRNLGTIDVTTVLTKSSNVGATKIALSLEPQYLWSLLSGFGIGQLSASGFPGESAGLLNHYRLWRPIGQATLAYGYGVSVTPLQLAQAYATIGARGLRRPVSLVRATGSLPSNRVIAGDTAGALMRMLETVVTPEGTGGQAAVSGYRVAGKTGTAWKYEAGGGYSEDRYTAVFAGLAPASEPRLAAAVVIGEPAEGQYYGGEVAAPVFAMVMSGALRVLGVPPDNLPDVPPELVVTAASLR